MSRRSPIIRYFGGPQDITSAGSPVSYLGPSLTGLYDGSVADADSGGNDCTSILDLPSSLYSNAYTYADMCYWNWTAQQQLDSISLYISQADSASAPQAVTIEGQDNTEDYNVLIYSTPNGTPESWQPETYNGQSALALHISTNVLTSGLRITYGRSDMVTHLGEVRIMADAPPTTHGACEQLSQITVPGIDGSQPYSVGFTYDDSAADGELRQSPTTVTYPYFNNSSSQYETRTCSASYDEGQRLVLGTDANSRAVQFAYDALGRLKSATYASGVADQNDYSCCGLLSSTDPDGRTGYLGYDAASRVTSAWTLISGQSQSSPPIQGSYDAFGNMSTVQTFTGSGSSARTSAATFDLDNRVTSVSYPGGLIGAEAVGYDSVGNPLWTRDGNGQYALYHHDNFNRLNAVKYSGTLISPYDGQSPAPDVSIGYELDSASNESCTNLVTSVTDSIDSTGTSSYTYDYIGRLATYTPPGQSALTYTYNNLGEETSLTTGNYSVAYDYYASGLLKDVKSGSLILASYTYDPAGVLTSVTYGNQVQAAIAHGGTDPRYPLSSITYTKNSNTLASFTYQTRDNALNPLTLSDSIVGDIAFGPYDSAGMLTSATYPNPIPTQPAGATYGYDWVGNRAHPPADPNPMVYNAVDELTSWPGNYSYSYDSAGNLTQVKNVGGAIVATYGYSPAGLLTSAGYIDSAGNNRTLTNVWDATGNRLRMTAPGYNVTFVYDIGAGIPAVIEEADSGGKTYYYYRDPSGTLIARRDAADSTGSSWQYYHYDETGSTRLLTDTAGNVTDTYAYDAYGSVIAHNGSTHDNPYQFVGALGYYTPWQAPEFRLLQLGFRFYDPGTGRFTQEDPVGDGINWYAYCDGNPLAGVDPWGLWQFTIPGLGGQPFLQFNSGDILPGLETGGAAVVSSGTGFVTFGLWSWSGGSWANQPGFQTSRVFADIGLTAADAAYGLARAGFRLEAGQWRDGLEHFHLGKGFGLGDKHLPWQAGRWLKNLRGVVPRLWASDPWGVIRPALISAGVVSGAVNTGEDLQPQPAQPCQ